MTMSTASNHVNKLKGSRDISYSRVVYRIRNDVNILSGTFEITFYVYVDEMMIVFS